MKLFHTAFWIILLGSFQAAGSAAVTWQPPRRLLQAISYVESSDGKFIWGDGGRSLGTFQLSKAAWDDVNAWRRSRHLKTYQYRRFVMHEFINRAYASNYLTLLHEQLCQKLGHEPTPGQLYAAYNMGMSSFAACSFQISRVNRVTAEKCRQISDCLQAAD